MSTEETSKPVKHIYASLFAPKKQMTNTGERERSLENDRFAASVMRVVLRTMTGRREKARPGLHHRRSAGPCARLRAAPAYFRGALT